MKTVYKIGDAVKFTADNFTYISIITDIKNSNDKKSISYCIGTSFWVVGNTSLTLLPH